MLLVLILDFIWWTELLNCHSAKPESNNSPLRLSHFNLLKAWQICLHSLSQFTLCGLLIAANPCVHGSFPVVGLDDVLTARSVGKRVPNKLNKWVKLQHGVSLIFFSAHHIKGKERLQSTFKPHLMLLLW